MPLSISNGMTNDLLMAEMNAVKETHGQADFAVPGLEFMRRLDDVHAAT